MVEIQWTDFTKVELRVGRILEAEPFTQALKPSYKLRIDFGPEIGVLKSSSQITHHYSPEDLRGKLIIAVVNFPEKQIATMKSQCLVTGFHDARGEVRLAVPDGDIPLGTKLL